MRATFKTFSRITASTLAFAAVSLAGCDKKSGATVGGPGAMDPAVKAPLFGEADNTFELTASSISLKQGDTTQGTIGIKRGTNFAQEVTLSLQDLPKGVAVAPSGLAIKSGATDAAFTLTVSDDAALGDFTVKVIGHPTSGKDAVKQFSLTVAKKDSFTLGMPFWTTALKQGETKDVSISINRDKKFDQDVTLKFEGLPKGVTVEPMGGTIKNGEPEAKFALKASDDAAPGDYTINIIGHPAKGVDASHAFKFTLAKK
jgi:uncharacterized membrane protein